MGDSSPFDRDQHPGQAVQKTFSYECQKSLTQVILNAIATYRGEDLLRTDFILFEDINPDALDTLFKPNSSSNTIVAFSTDGVRVELWGDGDVQIRVTGRADDYPSAPGEH